MAEKKKRKRAPRKPTVVESGRQWTAAQPDGIDWDRMSDGSYRYWLRFTSASGGVLRIPAEPTKQGLTPKDL